MEETRVLIVDDMEDAARTLALLLSLCGYDTRSASSGAEALAQVNQFAPHCILLDLGMPRMDGCELAQHLRVEHGSAIVLIAISGASDGDARFAQALEKVDHYLGKPIDLDALLRLLPPAQRQAA